MKTNLWKYFIDEEQTETWLNELAAEGLNCVGSSCLMHRYSFEQGEPGEYAYRIIIMDYGMGNVNTIRYLSFLQESGIEYVSHGYRHFILRKKIADGAFNLYTDRDSQIKANSTLMHFSIWTAITLFIAASFNLGITIWHITNIQHNSFAGFFTVVNGASALLCYALMVILCRQWRRYALRIKKLRDESFIYE